MAYDFKSLTLDTDGPASNSSVLFGADSQAASAPKPYTMGGIINYLGAGNIPYRQNYWYLPSGRWFPNPSGNPLTSNRMHAWCGVIKQDITIAALVAHVSTLSGGGNFQLAVYANDPATNRPTGNPLCATASMTTSSVTTLSGSAVSSALKAGAYWFCTNQDNSTSAFSSWSTTNDPGMAQLVGASTIGQLMTTGAGYNLNAIYLTQTFGTWPDVTGSAASWVETTGAHVAPLIGFQIGSVP